MDNVKQYSIATNSTFLFFGRLTQRVISFFTIVFLARYLGPEQYGEYTYIISFITLAAIFWNFGLNTLITRNVSRDHSALWKYFCGGMISKSMLFALALIIISIYFYIWESSHLFYSAVIFSIGTYLGNLAGVYNSLFTAFKRMDITALLPTIRSIILLSSVLLVGILSEQNVSLIFVCYLLSFIFVLFTSIILARKLFGNVKMFIDLSFSLKMIKISLPFFLTSAVNIFLFRVDHIMLGKISGNTELGVYGAAYTIFEVIISLIPMMLLTSAFPVLSRLYKEDQERLINLYKIFVKYFLWLALPISAGLSILGIQVCITLYGPEYFRAGQILMILGAGMFVFFFSTLVSWVLTACDRQLVVLYSNLSALIINIILNLIFIPEYGGFGAAASTIICESLNLLVMSVSLKNILKVKWIEISYGFRLIFATSIMSIPISLYTWQTETSIDMFYLFLSVICGVVLYGLMSYAFKTVDLKELKLLRNI